MMAMDIKILGVKVLHFVDYGTKCGMTGYK